MVALENPTVAQLLLYKLGKALARKEEKAKVATNRAHTRIQTISRLMLHLAGFASLTIAGFSWTITAGWIAACISCFAFSWLTTNSDRAVPPNEQTRR
jgi:hypothetical protein